MDYAILAQLNDDIPMKHHGQLCTILTQLLANLNEVVHSMKEHFSIVALYEAAKKSIELSLFKG
jgi:hypothetical protein